MKTETVKKLAVVALVTLVAACNTVQAVSYTHLTLPTNREV